MFSCKHEELQIMQLKPAMLDCNPSCGAIIMPRGKMECFVDGFADEYFQFIDNSNLKSGKQEVKNGNVDGAFVMNRIILQNNALH